MKPDLFFAVDGRRDFAMFNDSSDLTMEEITDADLKHVRLRRDLHEFASATWSSGACWFFVVLTDGLLLMNVYSRDTGLLCVKKSAMFIEWFLASDVPNKRRNTPLPDSTKEWREKK